MSTTLFITIKQYSFHLHVSYHFENEFYRALIILLSIRGVNER